eukprot:TRINITY_DN1870_c0_g1_i2.p1 TRINITY_DN1870_c0_g1~~TRINITY_DN1870_c0_g1_i2.p1  ORF type:complete len:569 (+),score=182.60 TRINITY_DN1870_c0_g1_i2:106-1707(+)
MLRSLVGSEMCIRDRLRTMPKGIKQHRIPTATNLSMVERSPPARSRSRPKTSSLDNVPKQHNVFDPNAALTPEESCFLYGLMESKTRGHKLKLAIPETVVVHNGQMLAWLHTSKEGVVSAKTAEKITAENINNKFIKLAWQYAKDSRGVSRAGEFMMIEWGSNQQARAVDEPGFRRLMSRVARALQKSKSHNNQEHLPHLMQAFIPIDLQMRYIFYVVMENGDVAETKCAMGRVDFRNPDGQRVNKPIDGEIPGKVQAILQSRAVALIDFMFNAHGLVLSQLCCEFVQSAAAARGKKDYLLNAVLSFGVHECTFDDDVAQAMSPELEVARTFLEQKHNADRVIRGLRSRRLSRSGSPAPGDAAVTGFGELGQHLSPSAEHPSQSPQWAALLEQTEMEMSDLSPAEISKARAANALSVPELAKAIGNVQKLANELLVSQEEHMAVGEQQSVLNQELKETINRLESGNLSLSRDVQQMEEKHAEMLQLLEESKSEFREEKERFQAFKTATMHHFDNVKDQIKRRRDMCADQVIRP